MEKSPGYIMAAPHLIKLLLPSVRIVILLRDPPDIARSRYTQCIVQTRRSKRAWQTGWEETELEARLMAKCGGTTEFEFEDMLLATGVFFQHNDSERLSLNHSMTMADFVDTRMAEHGRRLYDDYVAVLERWLFVFPGGKLHVVMTEQFSDHGFDGVNSVLRHVGFPDS